jgi:hypothetical protein
MKFLVYATNLNAAGKKLRRMLDDSFQMEQGVYCTSIEKLVHRLRFPMTNDMVAVLLPMNSKELEHLISIRHLLRDIRIILVLPDSKDETISQGHALRPRFLSYQDGDFSDVAAVAAKMIAQSSNPVQLAL